MSFKALGSVKSGSVSVTLQQDMGVFAFLKWIIYLEADTFTVDFINVLLYKNFYKIQVSLIFLLNFQTL